MIKPDIYAFADEASPEIDGQIAAMTRNGLNGLEIRNVDGINVSSLPLDHAKEVYKKLADAGLSVWSIGSPLGKINIEDGGFEEHLDKLRHTLEVANILEAKNIRIFSFYIPKDKDPEDYRSEVIDRLGRMLDVASDSGILLCHENEKAIYGDVASRCAVLHRALPSLAGVFDPANFIQCHQETLSAWELLKPYIHYLHIKDCLPDGTVVPAGEGVGHVREILNDYLSVSGRKVTIEPHLRVFDGLKLLEQNGHASQLDSYRYPTSDAAFDAACSALKNILEGA